MISGIIGHFAGLVSGVWFIDIYLRIIDIPTSRAGITFIPLIISIAFVFVTTLLGQFLALRSVFKKKIADVTKEKLFA